MELDRVSNTLYQVFCSVLCSSLRASSPTTQHKVVFGEMVQNLPFGPLGAALLHRQLSLGKAWEKC